ncbi:DUF7147 family protein [Bacillus methanolicus]|uniref:DUF7147 domain-containing protein n=1 Tax=Bacillus methanolicus (strain MGA3 / ATCC 53907) TaxID=796606 RepID=I3DYY8_BACMM|nr:hypothetical protein [Bacillus methanolicus]AIE59534.1 hypothetical protein BMMGA3_05530 [Bacillus methanolicus MGA3]EIJ79459.1 hypothetical protein MGA3_13926 [Bacillus methanolicus MGA3]UQD51593.1 methylthioribose kinase [Bacillus methanolicus]
MIQRFIELGEGYSDIYELIELAKVNEYRLRHMMAMHTVINGKKATSLVVILNPAESGNFQPLYICREGIPYPHETPNKRYELFSETAKSLNKEIIELDIKPSTMFPEKELFYQHLIGILRMNRYIQPLD